VSASFAERLRRRLGRLPSVDELVAARDRGY
jgi:hypothetical protein